MAIRPGARRATLSSRGDRVEFDARATRMTRRKLNMGFAKKTSWTDRESAPVPFQTFPGMVDVGLLVRALSKVIGKARPGASDFFATDRRVFPEAIDYPGDGSAVCSRHAAGGAIDHTPPIPNTVVPFAGSLPEFALFRIGPGESSLTYRDRSRIPELSIRPAGSADCDYPFRYRTIGIARMKRFNARHSHRAANCDRSVCSARRSVRVISNRPSALTNHRI